MNQYFIYFDRSQKSESFFIISEAPLFRQDPILITENKEEAESICNRLNDVLKSQTQTMMDDKDFFLK